MFSNLAGRHLVRASRVCIVLAMLGMGICASPANADIIPIESNSAASTNGIGQFTGTLDYSFSMALNAWTLKVTLENTTPVSSDGAITAFLFRIDSTDEHADATLVSSTNSNFNNLTNGNGQPFGNDYVAGASLDNSFQGGGGNPNLGITVGQSAMFTFIVLASDAASLTASSFINGPQDHNFIVRFRGFNPGPGGNSDKVPAQIVPGPTVLTALAFGLIMIPRRSRRLA